MEDLFKLLSGSRTTFGRALALLSDLHVGHLLLHIISHPRTPLLYLLALPEHVQCLQSSPGALPQPVSAAACTEGISVVINSSLTL